MHRRGFTIIELLTTMTVVGVLSTFGMPKFHDIQEKARMARAIGDIEALQTDITTHDSLPPDLAAIGRAGMLDPWGNPYVYVKFPPGGPPGGARLDRFNVPINTTFDLYSTGKDGGSAAPLQAALSQDDIVRGNDGGFIGLATKF